MARRPIVLAAACALLLLVAVLALAAIDRGEDSVEDVVPEGARVVARRPVDGATVLLVARRDRLQVVVAHKERGGWFSTEVDPAPTTASASWVATRGDGPVPALSAVYGRSVGAEVSVGWDDGRTGVAQTTPGEPFLVVREGHRRSAKVTMRGADGAVLAEVSGP